MSLFRNHNHFFEFQVAESDSRVIFGSNPEGAIKEVQSREILGFRNKQFKIVKAIV